MMTHAFGLVTASYGALFQLLTPIVTFGLGAALLSESDLSDGCHRRGFWRSSPSDGLPFHRGAPSRRRSPDIQPRKAPTRLGHPGAPAPPRPLPFHCRSRTPSAPFGHSALRLPVRQGAGQAGGGRWFGR